MMKSKTMRWAAHIAGMGEKRNEYSIWIRKLERQRLLGRLRYRWEGYIKIDLKGHRMMWCGLDKYGSG
jgi:hypothetical protein